MEWFCPAKIAPLSFGLWMHEPTAYPLSNLTGSRADANLKKKKWVQECTRHLMVYATITNTCTRRRGTILDAVLVSWLSQHHSGGHQPSAVQSGAHSHRTLDFLIQTPVRWNEMTKGTSFSDSLFALLHSFSSAMDWNHSHLCLHTKCIPVLLQLESCSPLHPMYFDSTTTNLSCVFSEDAQRRTSPATPIIHTPFYHLP